VFWAASCSSFLISGGAHLFPAFGGFFDIGFVSSLDRWTVCSAAASADAVYYTLPSVDVMKKRLKIFPPRFYAGA
jgi:hypothetical protein